MKLLGYAHWFMSIRISHMKDQSISVDQYSYVKIIVAKYLDTDTFKTSRKFYMTVLSSDMIFMKGDAYTSGKQVEKFKRIFNIQYIVCVSSFIYLLYTRVYLSSSVQKLAQFSSKPSKIHFDGSVNLLVKFRYNKTLGLKCYSDMEDVPLSGLLRQAPIDTKN